MSHNGHLPYYYQDEHTWEEYHERLAQFFLINDIDDAKKKKLLIQSMGGNINNHLSCLTDTFESKPFAELLELIGNLFANGTDSEGTTTYQYRLRFYSAQQHSNESNTDWLKRVKKLAVFCKFQTDYEAVVMDKFICGMHESPILETLLDQEWQDYPVKWDKIMEIVRKEENVAAS